MIVYIYQQNCKKKEKNPYDLTHTFKYFKGHQEAPIQFLIFYDMLVTRCQRGIK